MGVFYHKQPIVRDGLIFQLDADNNICHTSGSTTAIDTVNQGVCTLTNGVGFSNGAWDFDGVNDYIDTPAVQMGATYTLSAWAKIDVVNNVMLGWGADNEYFFYFSNTNTVFINKGGGNFNSWTGLGLSLNEWFHIDAVSTDSTTTYVYINGVSKGSRTFTTNTNGRFSHIGTDFLGDNFGWTGSISKIESWGRALTADEILQNYESQRWRYE